MLRSCKCENSSSNLLQRISQSLIHNQPCPLAVRHLPDAFRTSGKAYEHGRDILLGNAGSFHATIVAQNGLESLLYAFTPLKPLRAALALHPPSSVLALDSPSVSTTYRCHRCLPQSHWPGPQVLGTVRSRSLVLPLTNEPPLFLRSLGEDFSSTSLVDDLRSAVLGSSGAYGPASARASAIWPVLHR
jgi:hypothetical protein